MLHVFIFLAGKHLFNSKDSTTFQNVNQPATMNYVGPKATGDYGTDVVSVNIVQVDKERDR